ncbi:MAG: DciA family protein [Vampirovibrionales bacterium]|nr:DciA family protein [Vampirovibrionales bacterium]
MPQEPYRFNVGASPRLKSQKEYTQNVSKLVDVLPELSRQLRLDDKAKEVSVIALANHFLKTDFDGRFSVAAKASHIVQKRNQKTLVIAVRNGLIASELNFYKEALLTQLNHYSAQTEIQLHGLSVKVQG